MSEYNIPTSDLLLHERQRVIYNPSLTHQPSWSSSLSSVSTPDTAIPSLYPSYDAAEHHPTNPFLTQHYPRAPAVNRAAVSSILSRPPLPPRPSAYSKSEVRLIYSKSGFYLKQAQQKILAESTYRNTVRQQQIHGFLILYSASMENVDLSIAWIPEHLIDSEDITTFVELDGGLAIERDFPIIQLDTKNTTKKEQPDDGDTSVNLPFRDVYSLYSCPPSSDKQGSIIITTKEGDVLPPLWYSSVHHHDGNKNYYRLDSQSWPGYNIVDIINAFQPLKSSKDIPFMYLVYNNEQEISTAVTMNSMMETSHSSTATVSTPPSPIPETSCSSASNDRSLANTSSSTTQVISSEEARSGLLERLMQITRYSKETAAEILDHPIARPIIPLLPLPIQSALGRHGLIRNTVHEYQAASYYLLQFGRNNNTAVGSSNSPMPSSEAYFLADDIDGLLCDMPDFTGPSPTHTRRSPVSPEEWVSLFDHEGKLNVPIRHIRQIIFRGGLDHDIRIEAWKFLLGLYPWDSNYNEREAIRRSQKDMYFYSIKTQWFDHPEVRDTKAFQDEKHRIDKDVHRTDRSQEAFVGDELPNPDPQMNVGTNPNLEIMKDILVSYNFHNPDLQYVQGMSDLLAPLFVAMGDEAMAFWAFKAFMDRVQSNFYMDQSGMHGQLKMLDNLIRFMDPILYQRLEETETSNLFCCFRWLLVWFKREFEWEDVIRLWEVLWTDYLTDKMVLFIALAILDAQRKVILEDLHQFDEILKYINDLSGHIELEPTLQKAEILYYRFERKVKAMQRKQTLFKQQLQMRSIWNSTERSKIQERINRLEVPDILLRLLPAPSS